MYGGGRLPKLARSVSSLRRNHKSEVGVKPTCPKPSQPTRLTYKKRGAVALSSRLSTRFIGSFADKPTESGDSTVVWGRSPASQSGRPTNEEDTMAKKAKKAK